MSMLLRLVLQFGSGMAAISTTLFGLLKAGDHCVVHTPIYGGTSSFPIFLFKFISIYFPPVKINP
jgi:cystathionine beta-lyase